MPPLRGRLRPRAGRRLPRRLSEAQPRGFSAWHQTRSRARGAAQSARDGQSGGRLLALDCSILSGQGDLSTWAPPR